MAACRRCIALKSAQIIEAKAAMNKERRLRMEFDTNSFDIMIDNCCSHTLTNDINNYVEPPVKSTVRVRGYNGSTNSTMVGTVKWKIKDTQFHITKHILFTFSGNQTIITTTLGTNQEERKRLILYYLP